MNTHIDKVQENQNQSISKVESKVQNNGEQSFQLVDNRPETVAQRKLQTMANSSPNVMQLKAIQEMANNSLQIKQAAQLQTMADNRPQSELPIQKQENKTGLPDNLKSGMENLSGLSLDDVKVHRNSDKPAQLQAHAYAQGTDIHLASGQEKHLPHEAWHVVQQKQGRVKPTMQMKGKVNVNDDAGLEREADVMGAKALKMNNPTTSVNQMVSNFNGNNIVQRVLSNPDKTRLKPLIGKPKLDILVKPEYDKAQDKIKAMSDLRLGKLKIIPIIEFTEMLLQLNMNQADAPERLESVGQGLELGGAVLESSGPILSVVDMVGETAGGGISAALDIQKGAENIQKGKRLEGGSLLTSGALGALSAMAGTDLLPSLSSAAGLIPGVPDLFGTASAASKFYSGCAQGINTRSNLASLETLKGEVGGNQFMVNAINILAAKNTFYDAYKTMGLAAVEGFASFLGSWPKYLGVAFSKGFEPAEKLYASQKGTDNEESEEITTVREKSALSLAVKNTGGIDNRYHLLGRLYKLAKLTDEKLAEAMVEAGNTLPENQKKKFKKECK